ncbi:ethanolamine ammonia-lyase subunit EutB [Desulfosediminicola flagellatus]|uniref:ethanolamine ammonia-lyase subunit EutB n=1 Tax=Desulfosediminicola flagellatus TaxID=2569541 RepID=UPI0010AB9A0E|nr:ethanolamine ammonia-lyase subunit EutB [Desulfosediminicola flagellatus]
MKNIIPLKDIYVPAPGPEEVYATTLLDRQFDFRGLKKLLGAADISKAGDRTAGLAAENEMAREAARSILSNLTLQHIYDTPLTDANGRVDNVMRAGYEIDLEVFAEISSMTVGKLKDHLMASGGREVERIGRALTPVMAAALAKILDVHELVFLPRKVSKPTRARTLIGLPGCLSFRLQPNHPKDDLDAISLMVYTDLSMGMGDCLIGVNPSEGSVDNISRILIHLDKLRRETGAPSQICVLGHIKTQLAALEQGAPVEILFQSFAGTERTLTEEFDVTVEYMDNAYATMAEHGPLAGVADQFMYFETGQGSEMTYRKHDGIDMTTCEALCYGLCRRYDPFMVNNATGFIGPETHLNDFELMVSTLQDNFMGKILGLPMGISPSYTLHSETHLEGQQMAVQLATAAGASFFMDVYLGCDRMLAHFVNSGHDDQTMREIYGRNPAPEFLQWAVERGIYEQSPDGVVTRGQNWGNLRQFVPSDAEFQRLRECLPAAPGFDNAGPRPVNDVQRILRANQAVGREAVHSDLRISELASFDFRILTTTAQSKPDHLRNPELGSRLSPETASTMVAEHCDVQIVVTDGLSAEAVHHNINDLLPVLQDGLASQDYSMGQPILVPYGRVKLVEDIGEILKPKLLILLVGERPGGDALASRSLSAYLAIRLADSPSLPEAIRYSGNSSIGYEYTLITNIYAGGLPAVEAGSVVAEKAMDILGNQAAGNRLEDILAGHAR